MVSKCYKIGNKLSSFYLSNISDRKLYYSQNTNQPEILSNYLGTLNTV